MSAADRIVRVHESTAPSSNACKVLLLLAHLGLGAGLGCAEVTSATTGSGGHGGSGGVGGSAGAGPIDAGTDVDSPADAGDDTGSPLDGGASDPGSILCDGMPCASVDHYCCDDTMKGTETCVSATVSSCGGLRRQCDEAADCAAAEVCCIPPNAAPFIAYNTFCVSSCAGDPLAYQVCKTSAECENGQPCVVQPCHGGIIQSCGPLPPERCQ